MAGKAVIPGEDVFKLLDKLKTEDKDEVILKAVRRGKDLWVFTCTMDGLMSFHPPYVVHPDGKWDYSKPDVEKIDEALKKGEVVYYNPHIKLKKLKDYM